MEKLLNITEVAGLLNVSKLTIYKWIYKKSIPVIHVGRCPRFRPSEIESWLSSSPKKEPMAPAEKKAKPKRKGSQSPRNSEIDRLVSAAKSEVLG